MDPQLPKLPLVRTVAFAYATFLTHVRLFAVSSILSVAAAAVAVYVTREALSALVSVTPYSLQASAPAMIGVSLVSLAGSIVAVSWHRFLLLGERPRPSGLVNGAGLRAYVPRAAVLGVSLAVTFYGLLSLLEYAVPSPADPRFSPLFWLPLAMVIFGICVPFARLSIALPAAAIGDVATFATAWSLSRGDGWRLLVGQLLTFLPALFAGGAAVAAFVRLTPIYWALIPVARSAALFLVVVVASSLAATFTAAAYRFLAARAGHRLPGEDPAALAAVFS